MAAFMKKLRSASTGSSTTTRDLTLKSKKDEPPQELTPLEKLLQNAGPLREDGSDKFFGLENFGNTCYCNSIVQALYYCETFRNNVVNYPPHSPTGTPNGQPNKVNVTIRPPINGNAINPANKPKSLTATQAMKQRQQMGAGQLPPGQQRPEDKPDSPEYKKKQAMIKGPVLELAQDNTGAYGMDECTFTGLKDIFTALIESSARTGVLSPQRFLEIFKRENENFRNQNHQDAHEFYGLVLNDVIANVEANARRLQELEMTNENGLADSVGNAVGASAALMKAQQAIGTVSPGTGWVHDIFEGVLTSETKCLACETASQRDETFLDLSIDLEEHSSVTSCLRKFSDEEMLCERNKFHCDQCGGLQEAEKRMKIKKLPKVMALHLKRFKYTEDFTRLQKLFHRVVYPYHLRMFNTTDEAEDPDRLYELYAVVIHIGGNAYHGHYVSVIKTPDRGWLLFDDEMVEPVDKHFVRNFFGDKPGMACAYVLFYQETTHEKVMAEQEAEGLEEVRLEREKADLALERTKTNGEPKSPLARHITTPISPIDGRDNFAILDHAQTAPGNLRLPPVPPIPERIPEPIITHSLNAVSPPTPAGEPKTPATPAILEEESHTPIQSKEEKKLEKKEHKAAEKARKLAEKEAAKEEDRRRKENAKRITEARKNNEEELQKALAESKALAAEEERKKRRESKEVSVSSPVASSSPGFLNRANRGSKSLSRKSMGWLGGGLKDKNKDKEKDKEDKIREESNESEAGDLNGHGSEARSSTHADRPERHALKERFSISGIGRKKSSVFP
ncbi:putative ubiquitin carboxyl-terminal hydrolase creB [Cytospora mali]|uniref:Ubiquitin carboxyl-terminal hydrolase n=1 Tax=Cytospora mali TaxID=578113 RepID=A0A194V027_CYTMA|nr:putative ubiquitin carboxyl-terminal hydrolase creB [Valsa mali var. pyri (nom. inval.)]